MNVYLEACTIDENPACLQDQARQTYFEGKQLMMLTNTQGIDLSKTLVEEPTREALLSWYPLDMLKPEVTKITYQRFRYQVYTQFEEYIVGAHHEIIDYWSLM